MPLAPPSIFFSSFQHFAPAETFYKVDQRQPNSTDWGIMLLLTLMWGASFLMIKKALVVFDPVQAAFLRMGLASLAYLPFAALYYQKIDWKKWRPLLVVSLCGSGIPNYFFALAQTRIPSSLSGILNSLTPLFTLIVGVWFFQMKNSRNKMIGVTLGLIGAVMLILFGRGFHAPMGGSSFFAGFCVLATICYAVNSNTISRHLQEMHPIAIGAASFFMTGPVYFCGVYFSGAWHTVTTHPNPWPAVGCLAYLAVVSTALASMLFFHLLQRTNTVFATSVTYLLPIMAIILGVWDGEAITFAQLAGMSLILSGLYLSRKG